MIGRERQTAIYLGGVSGRRPRVPLDPERLEEAACRAMPADALEVDRGLTLAPDHGG